MLRRKSQWVAVAVKQCLVAAGAAPITGRTSCSEEKRARGNRLLRAREAEHVVISASMIGSLWALQVKHSRAAKRECALAAIASGHWHA